MRGLFVFFCVGAAALIGCGSTQRESPRVAPATRIAASVRPAPFMPPPVRAIPYDKNPDDPRALELLKANIGAPPAALDQAPAPELTRAALEDTARSEARGLSLVDTIHTVALDEKQRAELPVDMHRGDCLTVIAHGGLGVMEVDAFLAEHKKTPPEVVAEDASAGPIAVIGGLHGCYLFLKDPTTLDVIVQARKGSGPVVFAIYRARP